MSFNGRLSICGRGLKENSAVLVARDESDKSSNKISSNPL